MTAVRRSARWFRWRQFRRAVSVRLPYWFDAADAGLFFALALCLAYLLLGAGR